MGMEINETPAQAAGRRYLDAAQELADALAECIAVCDGIIKDRNL